MEKRSNCSLGAISPLFHNIFNISLTSGVRLHTHLLNVAVRFFFFYLNSENLICRGMDISKYFIESLEVRDNDSRLYVAKGYFHLLSEMYKTVIIGSIILWYI